MLGYDNKFKTLSEHFFVPHASDYTRLTFSNTNLFSYSYVTYSQNG